jgi:hypothetical protein
LRDEIKEASIDYGKRLLETSSVGGLLMAVATYFGAPMLSGPAAAVWATHYIYTNWNWVKENHGEIYEGFTPESNNELRCDNCGKVTEYT